MVTIEHHKHSCTCFQKTFIQANRHTTTIFKIPQNVILGDMTPPLSIPIDPKWSNFIEMTIL